MFLYHDGEEVDSSIAYMHSTEGLSWQRRTYRLDTDNDGDRIEHDSTFWGVGVACARKSRDFLICSGRLKT
ncbi:MAG: hypothetical protein C4B59_10230 [Candidatus Methanogaster sp.]|uniref:Uncharacterized protein n=1 Tax=Candidatus Methanogaster sp. TaxID=3386292 RepID=A0AC61L1Q3_9EURY|nr:MAG: hypothetical protein C4B59_10230 [ANME-2 cluster archaeon]